MRRIDWKPVMAYGADESIPDESIPDIPHINISICHGVIICIVIGYIIYYVND